MILCIPPRDYIFITETKSDAGNSRFPARELGRLMLSSGRTFAAGCGHLSERGSPAGPVFQGAVEAMGIMNALSAFKESFRVGQIFFVVRFTSRSRYSKVRSSPRKHPSRSRADWRSVRAHRRRQDTALPLKSAAGSPEPENRAGSY